MTLNEIVGSLMDQAQERESVSARDAEILREAAKTILNLALSLPNEPLTLDELRQMDGEPVWVEIPGQGKRWALVDVTWKAQKVVRFTYSTGASRNVEEEFIYGGKAYRRRPEEGSNAQAKPSVPNWAEHMHSRFLRKE